MDQIEIAVNKFLTVARLVLNQYFKWEKILGFIDSVGPHSIRQTRKTMLAVLVSPCFIE